MIIYEFVKFFIICVKTFGNYQAYFQEICNFFFLRLKPGMGKGPGSGLGPG